MNLKLSLHLMPANQGLMIFNNNCKQFRINRMENALQFVANMKQLSMAIDLDARQDCAYQLSNWKGLQWVLNCTFKQGFVGLEMWFQNQGFDEPLNTVFDWRGKADEFRDAVNFMITKMGRYKFFK